MADSRRRRLGTPVVRFELSGGGATQPTAFADPVRISDADPPFGIDAFDQLATGPDGDFFAGAAAHPERMTTSIDFNLHTLPNYGPRYPVEDARDVLVDLPPGLLGSVAGLGRCTIPQLGNGEQSTQPRPPLPLRLPDRHRPHPHRVGEFTYSALYNMAPPPGVPARFGFNTLGTITVLDASFLTAGGEPHLRVSARGVPQGLGIDGNDVVIWGVPQDESHRSQRSCPGQIPPGYGGDANL